MSLKSFEFSKVKSLDSDFSFSFENLQKTEHNSFTCELFEDFLQSKEKILSVLNDTVKEYLSRNKIQKEVSVLHQKQASLSHKLTEFQRKLRLKKEDKLSKDAKRELRERLVSLYENNLGLTIDITGNLPVAEREYAVSFVFRNINENRPHDKYSLVLATDGTVYKIYTCCPTVDGINKLLLMVNETNDLHSFTVDLRKKFSESVCR